MESIYKTLTSVFETINDLQSKFIDKNTPHREQYKAREAGGERVVPELSLTDRPAKEKPLGK